MHGEGKVNIKRMGCFSVFHLIIRSFEMVEEVNVFEIGEDSSDVRWSTPTYI